eukprot:789908_1
MRYRLHDQDGESHHRLTHHGEAHQVISTTSGWHGVFIQSFKRPSVIQEHCNLVACSKSDLSAQAQSGIGSTKIMSRFAAEHRYRAAGLPVAVQQDSCPPNPQGEPQPTDPVDHSTLHQDAPGEPPQPRHACYKERDWALLLPSRPHTRHSNCYQFRKSSSRLDLADRDLTDCIVEDPLGARLLVPHNSQARDSPGHRREAELCDARKTSKGSTLSVLLSRCFSRRRETCRSLKAFPIGRCFCNKIRVFSKKKK